MRTFHTVAALGAALFGLAPMIGQAQAKPIDACAVLTAADIESIAGDDMNSGRGRTKPWMDAYTNYQCDYRGEKGSTVQVNIERGRSAEGVAAYFKNLKAVATQTTANAPKPVAGLGDEAYWAPVSPTQGMLHVRVGTDVIWIQTYGKSPGDASLEKARALMEIALGRYAKLK